ncbi:hypothetical protein MDAP_000497 [Mitosporidium daphniae]
MRMKSSTASKEGFRAEKDVKEESLQQDSASPSNTCTVEEKAQRMVTEVFLQKDTEEVMEAVRDMRRSVNSAVVER